MGRLLQWVAIALLTISGALIVLDEASAKGESRGVGDMLVSTRIAGSIAALVSALCSGMTSALSERALHLHSRPSLVFSTELGIFELITVFLILAVEVCSGWEMTGDVSSMQKYGVFGGLKFFRWCQLALKQLVVFLWVTLQRSLMVYLNAMF